MTTAPEFPSAPDDQNAPATPAAKRNWFMRHKIWTAVGVAAVIGIGSSAVSGGGGDAADAAAPATTVTVGAQATDAAADTAADKKSDADAKTSDAAASKDTAATKSEKKAEKKDEKKVTVLEDGDYIVGTDIKAGQYRADVAGGLFELCTVSQSVGDDVIDVRNATEGSVIFDVANKKGSVVTFSGCENIVSTADVPGEAPSKLTNGDWLVGNQIKAGRYSATVDKDADIVLGSATQYDGQDVVDVKVGDNGKVVFTVKDIPGSVVSFSGFDSITKL